MILYLKKNVKEELDFNLRSILKENCALAAAINLKNASSIVCELMNAQEMRGEAGCGIVSAWNGKLHERRRIGAVSVQFMKMAPYDFERILPGKTAIGHNRYATEGDSSLVANVQPLPVYGSIYGAFAISHNGTLNYSQSLKKELSKHSAFQSTTDTELLIHLIVNSGKETIEEAILYALSRIPAAYSLLILTEDKLFAIRDKFGIRPLSIATLGDGYLVCSETYAINQTDGAVFLRDIEPGEMIVFERGQKGFRSVQYAEADEHLCAVEMLYFSNPRSIYCGCYHEDFRVQCGIEIIRENPGIRGKLVIPILDSGKHAARGVAMAIDPASYIEAFQRAHRLRNIQARSFTSPTQAAREMVVRKKLHLRKDIVYGKDVIIVDDTIVRATTMGILVGMLRAAGARTITVLIPSPPIRNICPNGMDYRDKKQLVASSRTVEEIREKIGADKLVYLTMEGMLRVVARTYGCGVCCGCFGGKYPVDPASC